jgi:methylase of polypeptide subunit release factors
VPAGLFPLQFGTQEQFAALRDLLRAAEYTESSVCRRLGIDSFMELSKVMPGRILTAELAGPLDALIRLFLECEPMTRLEIESWLGASAFTLLGELDLLRPDAAHGERCISPVGLHPTQSLYLVCDRGGELASLAEDVVYPAILENTQYFLGLLPATPCRAFLDLGTGTGVAALMAASRYAEHAWACDITERSVHFSEFNRRLNGLDNVTVARGDLYEPVEGLMFDRIVTHPPYVPVASSTCIFRDGGPRSPMAHNFRIRRRSDRISDWIEVPADTRSGSDALRLGGTLGRGTGSGLCSKPEGRARGVSRHFATQAGRSSVEKPSAWDPREAGPVPET